MSVRAEQHLANFMRPKNFQHQKNWDKCEWKWKCKCYSKHKSKLRVESIKQDLKFLLETFYAYIWKWFLMTCFKHWHFANPSKDLQIIPTVFSFYKHFRAAKILKNCQGAFWRIFKNVIRVWWPGKFAFKCSISGHHIRIFDAPLDKVTPNTYKVVAKGVSSNMFHLQGHCGIFQNWLWRWKIVVDVNSFKA